MVPICKLVRSVSGRNSGVDLVSVVVSSQSRPSVYVQRLQISVCTTRVGVCVCIERNIMQVCMLVSSCQKLVPALGRVV